MSSSWTSTKLLETSTVFLVTSLVLAMNQWLLELSWTNSYHNLKML